MYEVGDFVATISSIAQLRVSSKRNGDFGLKRNGLQHLIRTMVNAFEWNLIQLSHSAEVKSPGSIDWEEKIS